MQGLSLGWSDEIHGAMGGLGYGLASLNKNWNETGESFSEKELLKAVVSNAVNMSTDNIVEKIIWNKEK